MSEINNNLNDVPLSPDAIVSDDRVTVGQLRQVLDGLDDDTEIVVPITIFGIQVDEFEVSAVLVTQDRKRIGIVAAMSHEVAGPIAEDIMTKIADKSGDEVPVAKPFA